MTPAPDALVIGGGHNGLACAITLARAGRRVTILERRRRPGGLAALGEFHDGFLVPGLLHDQGMVRSWVIDALDLARFGLRTRNAPAHLSLSEEHAPMAAPEGPVLNEDRCLSRRDRNAWNEYHALCARVAPALAALMDHEPPDLTPETASGLLSLVQRGFRIARLPEKDLFEVARTIPASVDDVLNDWFEDPRLKGMLAFPALESVFAGPRSPGTGLPRLLLSSLAEREIAGGPAAMVDALLGAADSHGVDIRCEAGVEEILVDDTKNAAPGTSHVVGVRLINGEELRAPLILSSAHPRTTLLDMIAPGVLSPTQVDLTRNLRGRGTAARLLLALSGPLEIKGAAGGTPERLTIAPDPDHLERAFDDVKYRRFSDRPALELRVPSIERADLAPPGKHVVSVAALFAPRDLDGGWNETMREGFTEAILDEIVRFDPTLRDRIISSQLLTPADIEERFFLPGGHLFHIEQSLDQMLFLRPDQRTSRYRAPVDGLYLCGSASHPGGGLSGAPGVLAARAALADRGGRR